MKAEPSLVAFLLEIDLYRLVPPELYEAVAQVLEEIATFYRAKVEVLVTRVTGMMEPIIVIFMGASVGVILMSIYLPMFQMASGPAN